MNDSWASSSASSDQLRQARGVFGFIKTLGTATEHLFRRFYTGLQSPRTDDTRQIDELLRWRKQLEAAAQAREMEAVRLHAILESIGEGVVMQDTERRILVMNHAARDLIGSQKAFWDSALGQLSETALNAPNPRSELEPVGEPARVEVNNRILAAQIAIVADSQGHRLGTVIVLRDVTRAALAERLKDEFITQVSHELRTPLTAIKGMSDVLLTQPPDRPPNRRFLEAISRNVDVLDRMIVELLDISEISAGTFTVRREKLRLDDLIWSVMRGLEPRWRRAELEVHFTPINLDGMEVYGDDRRLRWALGHLLENSINYTLPGNTVTVQLGRLNQNRDYVLIHIHDTGVGISEYDLPRIFERFYRGEARTPDGRIIDPRGLGQGLFVARAVAKAHHGYLTVASKVGVGSTFTMALPLGKDVAFLDDEPSIDSDDTIPNPYLQEPPIHTDATLPNPRLALPPDADADTEPNI